MGGPPHLSPKFFFQNDSEWLEMDFKHNFIKCNILTRETLPPQCNEKYNVFFFIDSEWLEMDFKYNFIQ